MSPVEKDWETLRAEAALAKHQLFRTAAVDGSIEYLCCRWGMVKSLGSLDEARSFLAQVMGRK